MNKILFFLSLSLLFACSETKKDSSEQQDKSTISIIQGKVINTTLERRNKKASLCYYIPNSGSEKKLAVVFFFDPHAKGTIPVEKYKDIADSMNIILVGSNEMKNGMKLDQMNNTLLNLLYTTFFNLPTDSTSFIFAGFSGGGRVAIEKGKNLNNVRGIISCGAANEPTDLVKGRTYSVICGNEDFNYLECREIANKFSAEADFYEFNGAHEWPDLNTMSNAIENTLSEKRITHSKKLSNEEMILFAQEKNQQQQLRDFMGKKDLKWWKTKFEEINKQCNNTNSEISLPAKRLKNYISMTSYYYCDFALMDKNTELLEYCLLVYEMASPDNPDLYYFVTCLNCIKGNVVPAIESLNRAFELGFTDKAKILSTPQLEILKSNDRFWALMNSK